MLWQSVCYWDSKILFREKGVDSTLYYGQGQPCGDMTHDAELYDDVSSENTLQEPTCNWKWKLNSFVCIIWVLWKAVVHAITIEICLSHHLSHSPQLAFFLPPPSSPTKSSSALALRVFSAHLPSLRLCPWGRRRGRRGGRSGRIMTTEGGGSPRKPAGKGGREEGGQRQNSFFSKW